MPKKKSFGVNSKKEEGQLRKKAKKKEEQSKKVKANEDAKWVDKDKTLEKKKQKQEEEERKKRLKAQREIEKKDQLEQEYKSIKSKNQKGMSKKKKTAYELKQKRMAYLQNLLKMNEEKEVTPVNNLPLEKNTNREDTGVQLNNVDDALNFLEGQAKGPDRHPEKRRKAAWNRYQQRRYEEIKAEYPTLKRSQINERIFKEWQKSPENPMNQQ